MCGCRQAFQIQKPGVCRGKFNESSWVGVNKAGNGTLQLGTLGDFIKAGNGWPSSSPGVYASLPSYVAKGKVTAIYEDFRETAPGRGWRMDSHSKAQHLMVQENIINSLIKGPHRRALNCTSGPKLP